MSNNIVNVIGEVISTAELSHTVLKEDFYTFYISIKRMSGVADILPVIISNKLLQMMQLSIGLRVEVHGSFRSHNKQDDGKSTLVLYIFADTIQETDKEDENHINFTGFICKTPTFRQTPLGRQISDVIVAVNRYTVKSDYLPVVAWSRNAAYLSSANIGDQITAAGRIQSRTYSKRINDTQYEERTAYEVSLSFVEIAYADRSEDNGQAPGETEILQ